MDFLSIEFRYQFKAADGTAISHFATVAGTSYTACFVRATAEAAALIPPDAELMKVEFWQRHH
jgi:hypothetical protein